jgi:hypothetical protein
MPDFYVGLYVSQRLSLQSNYLMGLTNLLEVAGLLTEASRAAGRKQPAEHCFGSLIAPWRVSVF